MSTLPMDKLVLMMDGAPDAVRDEVRRLRHSGSFIVGVGVDAVELRVHCVNLSKSAFTTFVSILGTVTLVVLYFM